VFDFSNRLASRLAVLLTLALAPLGSIAIYSEFEAWRTQIQSFEASLLARTADAVAGQRGLLESAMLAIDRIVPLVVDRLDDPQACSGYLRDFIVDSRFYAFAGFIRSNGNMDCLSSGDPIDFSDSEAFQAHLEEPRSFFSFQPTGAITGRPVVLVNRPVIVEDQMLGFLAISISRQSFDLIAADPDPETAPRLAYLVNHLGKTLTSAESARANEMLPVDESLREFVEMRNGVFRAESNAGVERTFTIAELIPGQLYALGSWSDEQIQKDSVFDMWRLGFPILMWIASVAVVMFAVNYMVVRHLKQINSQLRRFALGNRDEFQRLPDEAPTELREIDSTFSKMARLIRRDEMEREEALAEKTVLLKEVHHRVKNNLQLIASILNLQMRRVSDMQARAILVGIQARVRSLASIHRTLYEQERVNERYAADFFDRILNEFLVIGQVDTSKMQIERNFEAVALPHDKIIPAALLFSEALTNALKYAAPQTPGAPTKLKVCFSSKLGQAQLRVWNSLPGPVEAEGGSGLGQELMTAFALQIHGDIESGPVEDAEGHGWEMRLRLTLDTPKGGTAS
jgi:two-component sensor histidine kinase